MTGSRSPCRVPRRRAARRSSLPPRPVLDREGLRRKDTSYLAEVRTDPATRLLVLWRGRPFLREGTPPAPVALTRGEHGHLLEAAKETVFLGSAEDARWLALELDGDANPAELGLPAGGSFQDSAHGRCLHGLAAPRAAALRPGHPPLAPSRDSL